MTKEAAEFWFDEDLTTEITEALLGGIKAKVEAKIQNILDETVRAAVEDYVKDGLFSFLTGKGPDLRVLFMPNDPLDGVKHTKPLIEILETELDGHIPRDTIPMEYNNPEDEDWPRVKILQAMIRAYYDNGGPNLKPYD